MQITDRGEYTAKQTASLYGDSDFFASVGDSLYNSQSLSFWPSHSFLLILFLNLWLSLSRSLSLFFLCLPLTLTLFLLLSLSPSLSFSMSLSLSLFYFPLSLKRRSQLSTFLSAQMKSMEQKNLLCRVSAWSVDRPLFISTIDLATAEQVSSSLSFNLHDFISK